MKMFFRIINDNYSRKGYSQDKLYNIICKDGQRKLLYTEIEFLSLLSRKYDLNEFLAVYVGSADGTHLPIVFDMFPQIEWVLVDPRKFNLIPNKKVTILNQYYDDSTHLLIDKINKSKKKIAFISDIRRTTEEQLIFEDMMNQMKWVIQLDSMAYMLKFRLPYFTDFGNDIEYLFGDIYPQVYTGPYSSESRLIYIRQPDEQFQYKKYNISQYDEQMHYFNSNDRLASFLFHKSDKLKTCLPGYRDTYENVAEYYFLYIYLKYHLGKDPSYVDVIEELKKLNKKYLELTHKNPMFCYLFSYKFLINKKNLTKTQKEHLNTDFKKYIDEVKIQLKDFKKTKDIVEWENLSNKFLN